MAHFAKIGSGNIVETVEVLSNDVATTEQAGVEFLQNFHNSRDVWKQTSYNTRGGVHILGGTPFRKNYAGVGWKYDQTRDAFIPPQPFASWTLNETTCLWDPPVVKPNDETAEKRYIWNEETKQWDLINE
tara:strand:+ start:138 stop:527 length:390 start_codon:yes stop_codon:yes gene_type:complete